MYLYYAMKAGVLFSVPDAHDVIKTNTYQVYRGASDIHDGFQVSP